MKKKVNKINLALAIIGISGAAFFVTAPAGVVTFLAYFFLASLVLPLVWDLS
jgi:predicted membrane-bound mannosyltransferase